MRFLTLILALSLTQVSQVYSQQAQSQGRNRTYTITVSALPSVGGTAVGGGTFRANTEHMVSAAPSAGYSFVNWTVPSGEVMSTTQSFSFILTGNAFLTANFIANPVQPPCNCSPLQR